ncbi:hypothetical protein MHU86_2331 [Fragilaria crotonensis]|nr:hypothetical protein MHU86_2331 [Fragilaria crotonensis]
MESHVRTGVVLTDTRSDVFATDVANTSGVVLDDTRYVAALSDVTCGDLETKGGVITFDELSDGVQAVEGSSVTEVHRGQHGTFDGNSAIEDRWRSKDIGWGVMMKIVHTFVKASVVAVFTTVLVKS